MERRAFVVGAFGLLAAPLAADGQPVGKVYRIGLLRAGEPPKFWIDEFREGLRELGYVEGHNLVIEFRIGPLDQLPQLAEDLVRSKVDVIVASASSAGMAAKQATTSIPIVFTTLSHPVEIGLIKSLARPGGNITGVTVNAGTTVTKRLELLRELVPRLKQVAVLVHPAHPTDPVQRKEMEQAARALGLQLKPTAVRAPEDFEAAFKAVSGAGALLNVDTPLFTTYRTQFVELAARNRLPAIWSNGIIVEAGGLMSYGTYIPALFRRAAIYVDKVLKGARPGDLPVEQPTQVRARHQPQDREGPRPDGPAVAPAAGRSGDRVMDRRMFLVTVAGGLLAPPLAVDAQPAAKVYRIGMLERTSPAINAANLDAFRRGLRDAGYVEGKNLVIEYRSAEGRDDRFPDLATELVRLKVDLIVTRGTPAALAAKNATQAIPVIITGLADPVGQGVVASLARPGGNVTGVSAIVTEIIFETGRAAPRAGSESVSDRGHPEHE